MFYFSYFANYYKKGNEFLEGAMYGIIEKNNIQTNKFYSLAGIEKIIINNYLQNANNTIINVSFDFDSNVFVCGDYCITNNFIINYYMKVCDYLEKYPLVALEIVKLDHNLFQFLPEKIKNNETIALNAIHKNYKNYQFIGAELQKNKEIAEITASIAIANGEYKDFAVILHPDLSHDYDFCKSILCKLYACDNSAKL